jgi:hypothetical protein
MGAKENAATRETLYWLKMHGLPEPIRNNTGAGLLFRYVAGKEWYHVKEGRYIKFGKVGSGDLITATKKTARYTEIETKSITGKPSPEQVARKAEVEAFGGLWILSRGWEDMEKHKAELLG